MQRRLTPELITAAALRVGDAEGPKAMTMRRIAAELDCDPMALYRHFPDRTALLDSVADLALADVTVPPGAWDERVRGILSAVREAAFRHPGIAAHVAARPPLQDNGLRLAAALTAALAEAGLSPADVVRATQALIAYVVAALAMSIAAGEPDARWRQLGEMFSALPGAPPGAELPVTGSAEQFAYGLRLLLNGIRAEAAA
ncbi:helix-turn-helix domain-containing protein [Micromonospora sp. NPDC049301]|uniref:TetR/AcrR family transcriptional regulator n=1 Tax=Micromonospora sp. NPDC049301 TaxID=3155723 RepID=UPI0034326304